MKPSRLLCAEYATSDRVLKGRERGRRAVGKNAVRSIRWPMIELLDIKVLLDYYPDLPLVAWNRWCTYATEAQPSDCICYLPAGTTTVLRTTGSGHNVLSKL